MIESVSIRGIPSMQLLLIMNIQCRDIVDLFDYEANPAYTVVEAPHQKQGKFSNL